MKTFVISTKKMTMVLGSALALSLSLSVFAIYANAAAINVGDASHPVYIRESLDTHNYAKCPSGDSSPTGGQLEYQFNNSLSPAFILNYSKENIGDKYCHRSKIFDPKTININTATIKPPYAVNSWISQFVMNKFVADPALPNVSLFPSAWQDPIKYYCGWNAKKNKVDCPVWNKNTTNNAYPIPWRISFSYINWNGTTKQKDPSFHITDGIGANGSSVFNFAHNAYQWVGNPVTGKGMVQIQTDNVNDFIASTAGIYQTLKSGEKAFVNDGADIAHNAQVEQLGSWNAQLKMMSPSNSERYYLLNIAKGSPFLFFNFHNESPSLKFNGARPLFPAQNTQDTQKARKKQIKTNKGEVSTPTYIDLGTDEVNVGMSGLLVWSGKIKISHGKVSNQGTPVTLAWQAATDTDKPSAKISYSYAVYSPAGNLIPGEQGSTTNTTITVNFPRPNLLYTIKLTAKEAGTTAKIERDIHYSINIPAASVQFVGGDMPDCVDANQQCEPGPALKGSLAKNHFIVVKVYASGHHDAPSTTKTWQQQNDRLNYYAIYIPSVDNVNYLPVEYTNTKGDPIGWAYGLNYGEEQGDHYLSIAYLGALQNPTIIYDPNNATEKSADEKFIKLAQALKAYAFNYITNTAANWKVENNVVTTSFSAVITNKDPGSTNTKDTILGTFPDQRWDVVTGQQNALQNPNYFINPNAGEPWFITTIRGNVKFITGNSFSVVHHYPGILPFMPGGYGTKYDKDLKAYLKHFIEVALPAQKPPTLGQQEDKKYVAIDTYGIGKRMAGFAQVMNILRRLHDQDQQNLLYQQYFKQVQAATYGWFSIYFKYGTQPSTLKANQDYYFYFDKNLGSLIGYPGSYGTDYLLNDHIFHYGYFIYTAASLALYAEAFKTNFGYDFATVYGPLVNWLINEVAYVPGMKLKNFPYYSTVPNNPTADGRYLWRNWNPYGSYPRTSGMDTEVFGPNIEASSEALNAYVAMIMWGEASHQPEITNAGIYYYTSFINSIWQYWFDYAGELKKIDPKGQYRKGNMADSAPADYNYVTQVHDGKNYIATFWVTDPLQEHGINLIPLTAGSFYLAIQPPNLSENYIKTNYQVARDTWDNIWQYTKAAVGAKSKYRWDGVWAEYAWLSKIADPSWVLWHLCESGNPEPSCIAGPNKNKQYAFFGDGETYTHIYDWISSLQYYGYPILQEGPGSLITTSATPMFAVFKNRSDGKNTYVVYVVGNTNKTNSAKQTVSVKFSDGCTINAVPNTLSVGACTKVKIPKIVD